MYKFVSKEEINAACEEAVRKKKEAKAKEREEGLNQMRKDISEYLSKKLEESQKGTFVCFADKRFQIPNMFFEGRDKGYEFPYEIEKELQEAGFMYVIPEDDKGKYLLI